MNLEEIHRDLAALADHDVLLHGSALTDRFTPRSDVDVVVLSRQRERKANQALWMDVLGSVPDQYDVRIFELLPLPVQMEIVRSHMVVFGDPVDVSYYLYRFRRRWKDQRHRIEANRFGTIAEKREAMRGAMPR